MMMAMCSGTAPPPCKDAASTGCLIALTSCSNLAHSNLSDLFFLGREKLVDFANGLIGRLLHGFGIAPLIVLGHVAVFLQPLQEVETITPYMSHSYARLLSIFVTNLNEFLTPLGIEFRDRQPQQIAFDN